MATLAEIRQSAGMSQVELGRHLGVTRLTVFRWESGKNPIPGWALLAWADLFDVDPREIVLPLAEKRGTDGS